MDIALIELGVAEFGRLVAAVTDEQWSAPTPCSDWDVRGLVNHVAGELFWVPPLIEGSTIAEVGDRFDGDLLGDDPVGTWAQASGPALVAAGEPGAMDRTVHLSFGDFPGREYLGQITCDLVVHGWDLARGIGADDGIKPDLLAFAMDFLLPQVDAWRGAGAFGPAVEVAPDAGAQVAFLAQTGRSPTWPT